MASANLNLYSPEEIRQNTQSVKDAMDGLGSDSYQTAVSQLFKLMGDGFMSTKSHLEGMIQALQDLEAEYDKLNQKYTNGNTSQEDFAKFSGEIASQKAELIGQISSSMPKLAVESSLPSIDAVNDRLDKYRNYFGQLGTLHHAYEADIKAIESQRDLKGNDATDSARKERSDQYKQALLDLANNEKDVTKILLGDLDGLSQKAIKEALKKAKALMKEVKQAKKEDKLSSFDEKESEKVQQKAEEGIAAAEKKLKKFSLKNLGDLKNADISKNVGSMGSSLTDLGKVFDSLSVKSGDTFSKVGEGLSLAGEITNGAADIAGGILQMGMNPIAGAAGILKGVTGIVKGIGSRIAENKKIKKEYEESQFKLILKEQEYNKVLRERLKITKDIKESNETYFKRLESQIHNKQKESTNDYNTIFAQLQQEKYVKDTKYKHGTWFRKAKVTKIEDSLLGKSYEEIEELDYLGKLEGKAKTLFDQLKGLHEEQGKLKEEWDKYQDEVKQGWTGTTTDAILDSIVNGFLNGKKSAKDFADDFEEMMKTAMMQAIKMKFINEKLDIWYQDFVAKSQNGLTENDIDLLKESYDKIVNDFAKDVELMEELTGRKFGEKTIEAEAQKGLAAMSQETATELNGRFYAIQYITSNINDNVSGIHRELIDASQKWLEIAENTRYCRKLEGMESDMRSMKNDISSMALKGIRLLR